MVRPSVGPRLNRGIGSKLAPVADFFRLTVLSFMGLFWLA